MAKVTVDSRATVKQLKKRLNQIIKDERLFVGAADDLKKFVRSGKNPVTGKQYKKLKESTIQHRRYIARNNSTHPDYSDRRSNLTITGQLVDGIIAKFNKARGELTLTIQGRHRAYKGNKKKIKGSGKLNIRIAEYLFDQGRPVIGVTPSLRKIIFNRLNKALRRL